MRITRAAPALLLATTACAPALTPRQELTWDAYKACISEGSTTTLDQIAPNGVWHISGREGQVFRVHNCMIRYWQQAAQDGRVPALPPALKVTNPASSAPATGFIAELPAWVKGDEWKFRSESSAGKSTFVWTFDREESIDGIPHYVIKSGKREIFYRKTDLALSRETLEGTVVIQHTPHRVKYVWPLTKGATWEQTYRTERPVDRRTSDHVDVATVEAEETITVPAGTFRTLKIAYRAKGTSAISYEEWYSPEARMWVRVREQRQAGPRIRELTAYTKR